MGFLFCFVFYDSDFKYKSFLSFEIQFRLGEGGTLLSNIREFFVLGEGGKHPEPIVYESDFLKSHEPCSPLINFSKSWILLKLPYMHL